MKKTNILIVDDDQDLAALINARLGDEGMASDVAYSADEAIAKMNRGLYDVVVADIHMPGMSGVEMVSALKNANPLVQVIMLTSDVSLGRVVECVDRGAMDFFSKTEDLAALLEAVRAAQRRAVRWINHVGGAHRKALSAGKTQ
ncbi:MAG: response regulator [Phycisphaerae bacterium]